MNLLGHIRVARTQSDDPAFWLGAALPDLQREAGVVVGVGWGSAVRDGITCHREADATFHELPVFRSQSIALTQSLKDAGVPRGAARAIGHAGWEILLDGALLDDVALMDAYAQSMAVDVHACGPHLAAEQTARWRDALVRRMRRGAPTFYAEPSSVTELLWRVLGDRPLLSFDRVHADAITSCLADAQPAIAESVDTVFAALVEMRSTLVIRLVLVALSLVLAFVLFDEGKILFAAVIAAMALLRLALIVRRHRALVQWDAYRRAQRRGGRRF